MSEVRLEELEEEISILCRKRSEILYQEGVEEPYLVFDNDKGSFDNNVWVLNPNDDYGLLQEVARTLHPSYRERFEEWLKEYGENSCTSICSITGTPRCCSICSDKNDCGEFLTRCGSLDKVQGLKECERKGKWNERK